MPLIKKGGFVKGDDFKYDYEIEKGEDRERSSTVLWGTVVRDAMFYKKKSPTGFVHFSMRYMAGKNIGVNVYRNIPMLTMTRQLKKGDRVLVVGERLKEKYYVDEFEREKTYIEAFMVIPLDAVVTMYALSKSPKFEEFISDDMESAGDYDGERISNSGGV